MANAVVGHVIALAEDDECEFVVFVHQDYQDSGIRTELFKQLVACVAEQRIRGGDADRRFGQRSGHMGL